MTTPRRVLAAVREPPIFSRLAELCDLAGLEVGRALDQETALALGFRQSFELVVSDLPLRGANLRDFLFNLTGTGSLSPGAAVVLYGAAPGAALFDGAGRVSQCGTLTSLLRRVAGHLGLDNRVTRRLRVEIPAAGEAASARAAFETENLSASGMLLRSRSLLPVGTVVPVLLELPAEDRPLEGRVEVVRHTDPGTEGVVGMGLRFVELSDDGDRRLASFLATSRGYGADGGGGDGDDGAERMLSR